MKIDRAFVLYALDYKDSSKILSLYTEHGHLSIIAHGVKKLQNINRFLAQVGTEISCTVSKGALPALRDGDMIKEFASIKQDVITYTYMTHILELVKNTITDELDHAKMYSFLQKIFTLMEQGINPEVLSFIFELKLLYFIGNGLHLHECTTCGKTADLVFHISSGGLTCKEHLSNTDTYYDQDIYNILSQLYFIDISTEEIPIIEDARCVMIRHILDLLYQEFVSYETKSRSILKQIKKY